MRSGLCGAATETDIHSPTDTLPHANCTRVVRCLQYDKADPNWTGAIYLYNNEDHADLWTETAIGESLTLV